MEPVKPDWERMGTIVVGADIGQLRDPTAVVVAEVVRQEVPRPQAVYVVRHVERLPLGTEYPVVAARIGDIVARLRRADAVERERLWASKDRQTPIFVMADATGVGRPVVELLRDALVGTGSMLTAVTFTTGEGFNGNMGAPELSVSKTYFASRLKSLTQSDRIHLPNTAEARALADELQNYELRATKKANLLLGAFKAGTHDDLATALGLAVLDEGPTQPVGVGRNLWG